jgi:hypothetical protein
MCIRVKPQKSVVVPDAISALPCQQLPIERGPLSFLANQGPSLNASSAAHGSIEENECQESSIFPTDGCHTTANNNTVDYAHVAYSSTKISSHNLPNFDSSFVDDLCDSTLPIELDPYFVNVGARLELGEARI